MKNKVLTISLLVPVLVFAMAFSVFAQNATPTATTTKPIKKPIDIACMKVAVEKRENAVQGALSAFSGALQTALQTRKSALMSAWDILDNKERRKAIKTTWEAFKKSRKDARRAHKETVNAAWKQFTVDRIACSSGPTGEEKGHDLEF